jgi:hypothetical protein
MVTVQQVQNADPVVQSINKLNALISAINIAAVNGWQVKGPLLFLDNQGNAQSMDLSSIPPTILFNDDLGGVP